MHTFIDNWRKAKPRVEWSAGRVMERASHNCVRVCLLFFMTASGKRRQPPDVITPKQCGGGTTSNLIKKSLNYD